MTHRRSFLKISAAIGTGLVLQSTTGFLTGCGNLQRSGNKLNQYGLQLYTLRDEMPKDPKGVLKQVSEFGYRQIESYEHDRLGMWWGMQPKEFRSLLNDLDMKIVSSHCKINKDFEKKADEAASLKMKYLICPYIGPQKSLEDYKRIADQFNACGEICRKAGLKFAYHNHDYSFQQVKSEFPQDILMKNTNASTVDFEMDVYWVVTAGQDPNSWLRRYPDRFRLLHVKDRKKNAGPDDKDASVDLGKGSIDYPSLIKEAKEQGSEYFIVEQELYEGTTALAATKANAMYMEQFR
jgi:sugar phosphate isomerase/epimerase